MTHALVYNIEPASPSMIRSLDRHCADRTPDGASAIDPKRSKFNRILVGNGKGVLASLRDLYASGVKEPAAQAESPYLRIVVSASPSYFRPHDAAAAGTWDEGCLSVWQKAVINHLRCEHGDDLVFAEVHLDEDTPHIHAVVAPTYLKKPRKPGRQKRGETPEQFEQRKAAALSSVGIRTVGRASHPTLSKAGSFQKLRQNMTNALAHLGIVYGEDRSVGAPSSKTTREWVKEQAEQVRKDRSLLAKERLRHESKKADLKQKAKKVEAAAEIVFAESIKNKEMQIDLERREQVLRRKTKLLAQLVSAISERLGAKVALTFGDTLKSIEAALRPKNSSEKTVIEQMDAARLRKAQGVSREETQEDRGPSL